MNKLVVSWFVMLGICTILTMVWQGGGGFVATRLTAAVSKGEATSISVNSTAGFRTSDTIYIEDEMILYTGKTATTFTGLTRAYNRTRAVAHTAVGTAVYSQELGMANQSSGAIAAQTEAEGGTVGGLTFNLGFLIRSIPQVVMWNYPFFDGQLIYLRYLLQLVGIGLTVSMVLALVGVFQAIFGRI